MSPAQESTVSAAKALSTGLDRVAERNLWGIEGKDLEGFNTAVTHYRAAGMDPKAADARAREEYLSPESILPAEALKQQRDLRDFDLLEQLAGIGVGFVALDPADVSEPALRYLPRERLGVVDADRFRAFLADIDESFITLPVPEWESLVLALAAACEHWTAEVLVAGSPRRRQLSEPFLACVDELADTLGMLFRTPEYLRDLRVAVAASSLPEYLQAARLGLVNVPHEVEERLGNSRPLTSRRETPPTDLRLQWEAAVAFLGKLPPSPFAELLHETAASHFRRARQSLKTRPDEERCHRVLDTLARRYPALGPTRAMPTTWRRATRPHAAPGSPPNSRASRRPTTVRRERLP